MAADIGDNESSLMRSDNLNAVVHSLYAEYGLQTAASYIYGLMRSETTATRLTITLHHLTSAKRLMIVDIDKNTKGQEGNQVVVNRLKKSERDVFVDHAPFQYYITGLARDDSSLAKNIREINPGCICACVTSIFAEEQYLCSMLVSSDADPEFSARELTRFKQFAESLADDIRHEYLAEEQEEYSIVADSALVENDPVALLKMCPGMKDVMRQVERVSKTNATVLIEGETGTGKDIVARSIHAFSARSGGAFVRVNCGAIPESLIQSELFGYERGAFTGAVGSHMGFFEQADRGTIFLDEVGELSPIAQVSLLRVLQTHEIQRIGAIKPKKINVRIIAATHRNLEDMVKAGTFRQDLLYRLRVFPIRVLPLRLRREDIPVLAAYFLKVKCAEMKLPLPSLANSELYKLSSAQWAGNVRELEHTIEKEIIMQCIGTDSRKRIVFNVEPAVTLPAAGIEDWHSLDEHISSYIRAVLEHCDGKIKGLDGAGTILGVSPSTLRSKMRHYKIELSPNRVVKRNRKKSAGKGEKKTAVEGE